MYKGLHYAWVILGVCFLNLLVSYSVRLGYGVILPEMIRDLGFGRTAGGTIYNLYLLAYITLTPFAGYLTDRIGARRIISACALLLGIGVLLMGASNSLWEACAAFGIAGAGAAGMWTPLITLIQRWYAPGRKGLALGILSTGYGIGFGLMGVAFPFIMSHADWRYGWYLPGSAALIMAVVSAWLLRSDPSDSGLAPWGADVGPAPEARPDEAGAMDLSAVLRHPSFWFIGLSYFAVSYALYGITTFMVDYARNQLGLPLGLAGTLATIHGFTQVAGVLVLLPLSDRLGRRRTLTISNAAIAGGLLGVVFFGGSWPVLCVLTALIAWFYGATWPLYGACAGDYFPRRYIGTVIGAWTPFYGLGAILTHWVSGYLRDLNGDYNAAFVLNAAMAAAALVLSRFARHPAAAPEVGS
jgi:sugar phosphate permease